jgi:hypothetical protein
MKTAVLPARVIDLHTRLVAAREAAQLLNLPLHYLLNSAKRTELSVPHYRVGQLLRFDLDELATWQRERSTVKLPSGKRPGGADAGL